MSSQRFISDEKFDKEILDMMNSVVEWSLQCRSYLQTCHSLNSTDLRQNRDRNQNIVSFKTPEELESEIDFTIPNNGIGLSGM